MIHWHLIFFLSLILYVSVRLITYFILKFSLLFSFFLTTNTDPYGRGKSTIDDPSKLVPFFT